MIRSSQSTGVPVTFRYLNEAENNSLDDVFDAINKVAVQRFNISFQFNPVQPSGPKPDLFIANIIAVIRSKGAVMNETCAERGKHLIYMEPRYQKPVYGKDFDHIKEEQVSCFKRPTVEVSGKRMQRVDMNDAYTAQQVEKAAQALFKIVSNEKRTPKK